MTDCLLCGRAARLRFRARDFERPKATTVYRLNWCDACDFGRLEGNFTPAEVSEFYPSNYYTHAAVGSTFGAQQFLQKVRLHLAWRVDKGVRFCPAEMPPGKTVCDLGCGHGGDLRRFKQAGYETLGVEPDPLAREAAKDAGEILAGTAESIPPQLAGRRF